MKSKSMNIRQMLQDIQAKRNKLNYAEEQLRKRLAEVEGRTPNQAQREREARESEGQSASNEGQPVSAIRRSTAFGCMNISAENVLDTPYYDVSPVLKEFLSASETHTLREIKDYLFEIVSYPKYRDGVVKLDLTAAGVAEGAIPRVYRYLSCLDIPNFVLVESDV